MTDRSVTHDTFVIERTYDASPSRVFDAFASPEAKASWSWCHDDWTIGAFEMDFQVGGREHLRSKSPDGVAHTFDAYYQDIVPGERIVYAYGMCVGDARISVSLVTIEIRPSGSGTQLTFTEQGAFLDGHDTPAQRKEGTGAGLANLDAVLRREPAHA